jgi:5,10-methylenetetrahydromethanopterin reductase
VTLALCAARTRRIALATGVTNPVTRHAAVLASAFATLDEFSGGRANIGIGVGESSVRTIGARPATLAELEACLRTLRKAPGWRSAPLPIWIVASGPRSLELAGRLGDGVLFQIGSDAALVRYGLRHIAAAGRPVRRLVRVACSVGDDRERARAEARGYAAVAAGTVYATVPAEELPDDLRDDLAKMKQRYDYYRHGEHGAPHAELVTDRILDGIAIAGTPEEAVPRFRELAALGVDGFCVPIATNDPIGAMRVFSERVAAHVLGDSPPRDGRSREDLDEQPQPEGA